LFEEVSLQNCTNQKDTEVQKYPRQDGETNSAGDQTEHRARSLSRRRRKRRRRRRIIIRRKC
jgi:hypothetical protein